MSEFKTRIQGIPCIVKVINYTPAFTPTWGGAMEDGDYGDDPEFDFDVFDTRGRPAPWLARKVTDADVERIEQEFLA